MALTLMAQQLDNMSPSISPYYNDDFGLQAHNQKSLLSLQRATEGETDDKTLLHIQENNDFKISLDVKPFKPNEVSIKIINGDVLIEAQHEERADTDGFACRHIKHRFVLPQGFDTTQLTSNISPEGILTVCAVPKNNPNIKSNETVIPIHKIDSAINLSVVENIINGDIQASDTQKNCDKKQ